MINKSALEYKTTDISLDECLDIDMMLFRAIKDHRLQALGDVAVKAIIDRLNLEPFLEFLSSFNEANQLPYHNYYHSTCVMLNCYEGAYYARLNLPPLNPFNMDEELRGLCAGALLHNFNHSGGKLSDAVNVKRALAGLKAAQTYASSMLLGLNANELAVATSVIKITQYPFVREPSTIPDYIIRDADQMQPYEESSEVLLRQYFGLKAESELQHQATSTLREFAASLRLLLDSEVQWHTEWAVNKAKARNWEYLKSNLLCLMTNDGQQKAN